MVSVNEFNSTNSILKFTFAPFKHNPEFHYLSQWCEETMKWDRVEPSFLGGRAHFSGEEVPPKVLEAVDKYIQNGYSYPQVLVFEEKHGTRYFDASTPRNLGMACLKILSERLNEGYYTVYGEEPEKPKYLPESVANDSYLKKQVEAQWGRFHRAQGQRREALGFVSSVQEVLVSLDYFKAYRLIDERSGYEYERAELECCEIATYVRKETRTVEA